jgi:phosphoserine phosphatase RsbX
MPARKHGRVIGIEAIEGMIEPVQSQSSTVEWAVRFGTTKERNQAPEQYVVKATPSGFLIAIVDGMAHSPEALMACQLAVEALNEYTHQNVVTLFERCDRACKRTSGVSITAAIFNTSYNTVSWFGVGNVEALLWHRNPTSDPRYHMLVQQPGLVGHGLLSLKELSLPVRAGDLLILASDGIKPGIVDALPIEGKSKVVADSLIQSHARPNDDATILVTRYLGGQVSASPPQQPH